MADGVSAFGVEHSNISKATKKEKAAGGAGAAAAVGAAGVGVASHTYMPEHSHYSKATRKHIASLPAGVHEVDTKMLAKRPRKLGARHQQTPYVAAMAQERPEASFKSSPVPVTRYKDGIIQRDNAHSVMANAMKGRKTTIKVEDAPGYRPKRRTGEELVRRGQMKFQEKRLKRNFDLPEKKIESHRAAYKQSSRDKNTAKRPHGVVEEELKYSTKPYSVKTALKAGKNLSHIVKSKNRDRAAGATGAAGVGVLASTPVRRSASKVTIKDGQMSSSDAKKIVSPGYRPGNKKAIRGMAANLGELNNTSTTVVRYKDGTAIPFDGNHRATARIARGDKSIPVHTVEGGERPAVSVTRNAVHGAQQKLHQSRMKRGVFTPDANTPKHAGESKLYSSIANGSKARSGKRVSVGSMKLAQGPTKNVLRGKQALTVGTGAALLGTAHHLGQKKKP